MSHTLSLLFYIKKSKADELGKANIYLRITLDGQRAECSVRRKVKFNEWNSKTQLAIGNSIVSQEINRELGIIRMWTISSSQDLNIISRRLASVLITPLSST